MHSNIDLALFKNSKFRLGQRLNRGDLVKLHTLDNAKLAKDAKVIIQKKLAPKIIENDGKQTPFRGHPVFVAQHATATCCRECLFKWHGILQNRELENEEIDYVVKFIMLWLEDYKKRNSIVIKSSKTPDQLSLF